MNKSNSNNKLVNTNLNNKQKVYTIDLNNPLWDDDQIVENMKSRQQEYKYCYELNIKNCNIINFFFPYEVIRLTRLNINRTNLESLESLHYTININSLNLSNNKLKKIPDIFNLFKLEMLILNDNFIEKVDFTKFKDLRYLQIINLQNNEISFRDVMDFTTNINHVKDKLKQLKNFSFTGNPYYKGAPKEKINEFLDFYQKSFLNNFNFESQKEKLEKEFTTKLEEINDFQIMRNESLGSKVVNIKKQIEAFSHNPVLIDLQIDKFKENTNNFLQIMNSTNNKSKLGSSKSAIDEEFEVLEELFCDIIRDLNILSDKVENKAFIEQCMHFLVGILLIKQGYLAESIMELLTHIAEHKKMQDILVKNLVKNFIIKEDFDFKVSGPKGDDDKTLLIEEIKGQSGPWFSKKDNDDEEISIASILKSYPKILESFKMIVHEKYQKLYVYLFRIILKNFKYTKLIAGLDFSGNILLTEKEAGGENGTLNSTRDANSYIYFAIEFFHKCFTSKSKQKILQNMNKFEIMKLFCFSIGIFQKYELYLTENSNYSGAKGKLDRNKSNSFLDIVVIFAKIFKSILKFYFFPYLNKKVFSYYDKEERIKFINFLKSRNNKKEFFEDQESNENSNIDLDENAEFERRFYVAEFIKNNLNVILDDIINKDINNKNKKNDLKFENINGENFHIQFDSLLSEEILDIYKNNINQYRKDNTFNNSNFNNFFIITNKIFCYMLKINIMIKSGFVEPNSNSYLNGINFFFFQHYQDYEDRINNAAVCNNMRVDKKMEKSKIERNNSKIFDNNDEDNFNQDDSIDQDRVKDVQQKIKGDNGKDFILYDSLVATSINFIFNLALHQNSLYSQTLNDGYLTDFQDKFQFLLKRLDENAQEYKNIYRSANFYQSKKEEVSDNNIVAFNFLSNSYMMKFIDSSLNILVFLGKLNELTNSNKNNNLMDLEAQSKLMLKNCFLGNKNNAGAHKSEKIIEKISVVLNKNNRDDIMLKCINIPNMNIKRKIMEVLLTVSYEQIDDNEFAGLIATLQTSNFLEMGMDEIVTKAYLFIIRLLNEKMNKRDGKPIKVENALECGIKIALESNTRNYFKDDTVFKSAQNLNLILAVFLINLSAERKYDQIYFVSEAKDKLDKKPGKAAQTSISNINQNVESIKKIILSELESVKKIPEKNQDFTCQMLPYFYEKVSAMWNVNNIREFLLNNNIKPYNFVVLRLFRQMADLLMNIPYPIFNVFESNDDCETVLSKLKEEFKQREADAIAKEKKTWEYFKSQKDTNFKNAEENKNNIQKDLFKQNEFFARFAENLKLQSNKEEILNIMSGKVKFITLSEENWKDQKFVFADKFKEFLNFLCGESNDVKSEVQKRLTEFKFDEKLRFLDNNENKESNTEDIEHNRILLYSNTQNTFTNEPNTNRNGKSYFGFFKNLLGIGGESKKSSNLNHQNYDSTSNNDHTNADIDFNNNIRFNQDSETKNLEPVIKTYLKTIDNSTFTKYFNFNFYTHIKEDLREECDTYGSTSEKVFRIKEHETVDNCFLRSLIVSAFLRCIYALTKGCNKFINSKTSMIGRDLIKTLRNTNTFQKLILLVDCTKMQDSNINTKILIIIKHIFTNISQRDHDDNGDKKSSNFNPSNKLNSNASTMKRGHNQLTGVSKFEFQRLILIASIIIEKTLDNIYFNQRPYDQDGNENSFTLLVRKLVKCCLCIKKELFKNSTLNAQEKKDLLKKILSTRLILVLINHALKIMENDIPLQKNLQKKQENLNLDLNRKIKNKQQIYNENDENEIAKRQKANTDDELILKKNENFIYNQYYLDLVILLAEFISCREEIYIIIIEYVCKKYYLEKKPIRQSFIKDIADLRYYSYCTRFLEYYKQMRTRKDKKKQYDVIECNFDNILFVSVSKVAYADYQNNKKRIDPDSKHNPDYINNEICILILDQNYLVLKQYDVNKKTMDFSDFINSKILLKISLAENPIQDVRYFSYGNRLFLKPFENKFLLTIFFKKSIESNLFVTSLKNIHKDIEFHKIDLEIDKKIETSDEGTSNEDVIEDQIYNYELCSKKCFKKEEKEDTIILNNQSVRSKKINNKSNENDIKNVNYNGGDINKQTSEIRSVSSNNKNSKNGKNNKIDIEENEFNNKNSDNLNNEKIISPKSNKKMTTHKILTGVKDFEKLKQKYQKGNDEKTNKLNETLNSYKSKKSLRSKSGKLKSTKNFGKKLIEKTKEDINKKANNNDNNEKIEDEDTKLNFSDKILSAVIDFSNFSNIDDLNEEAFHRNLYIIRLARENRINIYKEKDYEISQIVMNGANDINNEEKIFKRISESILEINRCNLGNVKNILFDNRKILIDFKNSILNRPIQIYPVDDRSFFHLRSFFIKYIYKKGLKNYSKNYLIEPMSHRIFKN